MRPVPWCGPARSGGHTAAQILDGVVQDHGWTRSLFMVGKIARGWPIVNRIYNLVIYGPPALLVMVVTTQTGTIPSWAQTLEFVPILNLRVDGVPVVSGLHGADVHQWAGQQVTLDFSNKDPFLGVCTGPVTGENAPLDIVGFIPTPEPSTWALLTFGLGALIWSKRRREGRTAEGSGRLPPGWGRGGRHCSRSCLASRWVGAGCGLAG